MINKLLTEDRVKHLKKVDSWQEGIKQASAPLLAEGVIEESYVQAMVQNVKENGPYIVLKEYLALPHAAPGAGVNNPGLALLTLDEAVDLLGNPVKIFLVLAAIDSTAHLEALAEISEQLMDDEIYEMILNGDTAEIVRVLGLKGGGK